jgi:hypothetical protein
MSFPDPPAKKTLIWVGSSKRDLIAMPISLRKEFGVALDIAQQGLTPEEAKLLKGKAAGATQRLRIITVTPIVRFTQLNWKDVCMCCTVSRRNQRRVPRRPNPIWI